MIEGDLYVRPVDDPDAPWRPLGRGTATLTGSDLSVEAIGALGRSMKAFAKSVEFSVSWILDRRTRRLLFRLSGPWPLAPGCLPASKLARRGWR